MLLRSLAWRIRALFDKRGALRRERAYYKRIWEEMDEELWGILFEIDQELAAWEKEHHG